MLHHRAQSRLLTARRVVALAAAAVLTVGGTAVADDVYNKLDTDIDATAESVAMNVGTTREVLLYVDPTGTGSRPTDGKSGCNLDGSGSELVISTASSDSTVATANLTDDTFTSCGDTTSIRLQALKIGTTTITVGQVSLVGSGTFNYAPATFTVTVAAPAPANTAPQVSVTGVVAGAAYPKGAVPSPGCLVEDAEDGTSTPAPVISGTLDSDGLGAQTATCNYTDAGKLTASSSATYSIIDPSAPTIGYTVNPVAPDGLDGWYRNTVTLTWHVSEPDSPNSLAKSGCVNQTITADQISTEYTCSATSSGGSAGPVAVSIKRDGNGPVVAYDDTQTATPDGANGWYVSPVIATFKATDAFSGMAAGAAAGTGTSSAEGAAVSIGSPAFTDRAGNTTAAGSTTAGPFKIDLSDPVLNVSGAASGSSFDVCDGAVTSPTYDPMDAISGLDGTEDESWATPSSSTGVGTYTYTATATDVAGRTKTETRTFKSTYGAAFSGALQPINGGATPELADDNSRFKVGSTVPVKFRLTCGSTPVSGAVAKLNVKKADGTPDPGTDEAGSTAASTTGNLFRYDATAGQYIFNLSTKNEYTNANGGAVTFAAGTYTLSIMLDDGTYRSVNINLVR